MRESLMRGHGDAVVLGTRIRLLVVWTLEAYHYRFRYLFLFLSFVLRVSFPSSLLLSLVLLQPRTKRELYLSSCRLIRPKETQYELWRKSLRARIAQVVEEVRSGGLRKEKVDPRHVKVRECPKWNT